jgi:hypothetical protein
MILLALAPLAHGQETNQTHYPRAEAVITVHALQNETGREFMTRNAGGRDLENAFETILDEVLLTETPYQLPRRDNPYYSAGMESSVGQHDNFDTVHVYKRGIFIGYAIFMIIPQQVTAGGKL